MYRVTLTDTSSKNVIDQFFENSDQAVIYADGMADAIKITELGDVTEHIREPHIIDYKKDGTPIGLDYVFCMSLTRRQILITIVRMCPDNQLAPNGATQTR